MYLHDAELLAVGVELVDQMRGDLDVAAVEVELAARFRRRVGGSTDLERRLRLVDGCGSGRRCRSTAVGFPVRRQSPLR